jgi:hypothetical protein
MTEKKEGPVLAMAVVTLVLIVVMGGVSAMTLYTALYPPDFEKRAEQVEQERAGKSPDSVGPAEINADGASEHKGPGRESVGLETTENSGS